LNYNFEFRLFVASEFMEEIVNIVSRTKTQKRPSRLLRCIEMELERKYLPGNSVEDPADENEALREALEKNALEARVSAETVMKNIRGKKDVSWWK